jgi:hypothetical protein
MAVIKKHKEGQDTGSGVYHPCLNVSHHVIPRGVGITNTISRAELTATATAIIHGHSHVATDSLTSMHLIKKQLSRPDLHRHNIQWNVLQSIAKSIHQSPSPIHFHKVKSHAGIGNENADALARKSINTYSDVADYSIETAGPGGYSFYTIYWLAKEYEEHRIEQNHPNTAQSPTSRLWYISNHNALQAHMHPLQKLGNASTANYHENYQTLIKWLCQWSR